MPHLSISLLGHAKISIDGVPVRIPTLRAIPLLAYLSITGVSHTRESIANLLWSESNLSQGLAALRTTLWRMKSAGLDGWLNIAEDKISLNQHVPIQVDVLEFKEKIERCKSHGHPNSQICLFCVPNLTEAVELYRGEFLTGINLSKAQIFDEWRLQEGEGLQALYEDILERLVKGLRILGDFNLSIQYARLLLRQDPYNEAAHYDLMQLYSVTGQRAAAINQYKHYKELLTHELNLQPSDATTTLYKQILSGRDVQSNSTPEKKPIFLMADIENASLLWEQAGDKKDDILTIFHNIFNDTAKRFGGYILQKSEDKLTLLFEKGQPLHCAVTIHLKLKKAEWGPTGPPIVRMVLYSTFPEDETQNEFSFVTRTPSNLLSVTWGGQIIFSEKTLALVDLPPGSRIRDMGFHNLKELKGPIHVYELLHPHVPISTHQALRSGSSHSVNFPNLTPAFFGREIELNELASLVDSPGGRIITLVGPGGVGKTRLAIEFALANSNRFPDGAYFVSLASVHDPDLIPIVLAEALKFSFYGTMNQTDQLVSYLHRMNVLLVFDNFEHLRVEGASFLAYLLSGTHYLKILVTSRERLGLLSEYLMEIQGLPVPVSEQVENANKFSSMALFISNAQRISPKFKVNDNVACIIRICQLVNGLPLAIILASSWARIYNCRQIADEIEQNIDFLTSSAIDLPPRHRSLHVVFDNSWKLLSEDERFVLQRLSIFPASFTFQAAQSVCDASLQLLSTLVDKSLLIRLKDRFTMLDTFRHYVYGKLEAANREQITVQQKFLEYFADFFIQKYQRFYISDQPQALSEMRSESENVRTAWDWMIESDRWDLIDNVKLPVAAFHEIIGNFIQGRELFEHALIKLNYINDPSLDHLQHSIHMLVGWMTVRNGFITKGIQILSSCLESFTRSNSQWNILTTQMSLADANRMLGNYQLAKNLIEAAIQGFQSSDYTKSNESAAILAYCQSILGAIHLDLGEYEQAEKNLKSSLATHNQLGSIWGSIHPLLGLGKLSYMEGDFIQARDLYLQALNTAENIYDQRGMAMIHNNLSGVYEEITNQAQSYQHIMMALNLCKETGDRRMNAMILNNLAYHQLRYLNDYPESIHTYQESIQLFFDIGDLRGTAYSFYDISKAYIKVGLLDDAWDYCSRSMQTAMTLDSLPLSLHSLHGFANLYANTGQIEQALGLCYLIENHPLVEPDTKKRAIVSRSELEAATSPEIITSAHLWADTANLQYVIDQSLINKEF